MSRSAARTGRPGGTAALTPDPGWYKDAVIYELHVRAFADGNDDGIGDFRGLTGKLDYLQELGVTALWLLPFYPSPLRDDGYDIADYRQVHPSYGTLKDFRRFLREAHRRGLRVITELVINHTSDQHPWFQKARRAGPGSRARDFYVWSDTATEYQGVRIIFPDFEHSNWTWDPVAGAYYWHRFYSHQPDLNFDNPVVRREVRRALDFWMKMGVDGMRLDAIPYLYERDGTNCENLPEGHGFLKELRAHVDASYPDRMLLAEANQWPEDVVDYFGDGDECHMAFHFPLMPRLFMATRMEDRFPIVDIMEQTPGIPEGCQWAIFLRNHDELTLEMVTDEERDYMWRVYANDPQARINVGIRRRLAPLLGNNRRQIELMNGLLFSMPGTPVLYYGDEIGMGDNIYLGDRDSVRTPMQWSPDRNAGFSRANPQKLYLPVIMDPEYNFEAINVEMQHRNPQSLWWWMTRLIGLRTQYRAFSRGELVFLDADNPKVLAFLRRYADECILVVANLGRFAQSVHIDLTGCEGMTPMELFGHNPFPVIGGAAYPLTLGPHSFYWFALQPPEPAHYEAGRGSLATMSLPRGISSLAESRHHRQLEGILAAYLPAQRWFRSKSQGIAAVKLEQLLQVPAAAEPCAVLVVRVEYRDAEPELYVLPVALADTEQAESIQQRAPRAVIAGINAANRQPAGVLYDAVYNDGFNNMLLNVIRRRRGISAGATLQGRRTEVFGPVERAARDLWPRSASTEQSNSSVLFGDAFVLKLYRRLEPGANPELELTGYLTRKRFSHIPAVAGSLEYQGRDGERYSLGVLQSWVANEGDAWGFTLDALARYFERAQAAPESPPAAGASSLVRRAREQPPETMMEADDSYLALAHLLGQRTAELHRVLADAPDDALKAERFSELDWRSLYQSLRNLSGRVMRQLRRRLDRLPGDQHDNAREVLAREGEILARFAALTEKPIEAERIRCHGDYHLGQVLFTGRDFVILDFEGEPARPLSERRLKRSPLRDVAGMMRSFDYAARVALDRHAAQTSPQPEMLAHLRRWGDFWVQWASASFLSGYLEGAAGESFLPADTEDLETLLAALLLEKAIYELGYELDNRPDWVWIPMRAVLALSDASG